MHSKNHRRQGSPSSSRAPLLPVRTKMTLGQSEAETPAFRVPHDFPHSRFNKAPLAVYPPKGARTKACVSLPVVSLEKMPCFNSTSPTAGSSLAFSSSYSSSSSPSPSLKSSLTSPASHKSQEKLLNGRGPVTPRSTTPPSLIDRRPSPSRSPLEKRPAPSPLSQERRPTASTSPSPVDRRLLAPPSPPDRKHQNGAKGAKHRRVSGRVFDPNKHCGVLDPETNRPCARSLTCKTHSLTHRRAVQGRKKNFDLLLAEHKGRAKEKEAVQKKEIQAASQSVQATQSHDTAPSLSTSCLNGKTTSPLKLRLASSHIHRSLSGSAGAVVLSSAPTALNEAPPICQKSGGDTRLSSDEGEADAPEETEKPLCHYSPHHPRPLSCCVFSSRLMGRGHYVFDRRWDQVRLALHCMVEQHVNSLMWRKVPLVVDSRTSTSSCPTEASSLSSQFPPHHVLTPAMDGVSMVSSSTSSTSSSHNSTGVFCVRDPEPGPKLQPTKPHKPFNVSAEGPKKWKSPSTSESGVYRKSGNSYNLPAGAEHIRNGPAAISMRAKPRPGAQGLREDRYNSVEFTGVHGGVSSHPSLPFSPSEDRKRRSSRSSPACDKPSKSSRSAALDEVIRKSRGLLPSLTETPHSPPHRQAKVPH